MPGQGPIAEPVQRSEQRCSGFWHGRLVLLPCDIVRFDRQKQAPLRCFLPHPPCFRGESLGRVDAEAALRERVLSPLGKQSISRKASDSGEDQHGAGEYDRPPTADPHEAERVIEERQNVVRWLAKLKRLEAVLLTDSQPFIEKGMQPMLRR
jgi:hypothetical protein